MDKSTETHKNRPVSDDMPENDTMHDNGNKAPQNACNDDWQPFGPWVLKNNGDGTALMKWRYNHNKEAQ